MADEINLPKANVYVPDEYVSQAREAFCVDEDNLRGFIRDMIFRGEFR